MRDLSMRHGEPPPGRAERRLGRRRVPSRARADPASGYASYFALPAVRRRIRELLGGSSLRTASARFVVRPDPWQEGELVRRPVATVWRALRHQPELSRSLLDRRGLIADLEFEHVHFDLPAAPFDDPVRSVHLQELVVAAVEKLATVGIPALHVFSGRGHHFLWSVPFASPAFAGLAALGARLGRPVEPMVLPPPAAVLDAHHALGLVLEELAHRIQAGTEGQLEVPLMLTAVRVGAPTGRHEIVSLDLSAFGDPIDCRGVRIPFTGYLKPVGVEAMGPAAPRVVLPVGAGRSELEVRHAMASLERAGEYAREVSAAIPEAATGSAALLSRYEESRLAVFHREYFAVAWHPPERWAATYDRLDLGRLPPCVARILQEPNDRILQPAAVQHLVRLLLADGWQPRHVAGLVLLQARPRPRLAPRPPLPPPGGARGLLHSPLRRSLPHRPRPARRLQLPLGAGEGALPRRRLRPQPGALARSPARRGVTMADWPVGLSTGCFYKTPIFDCLERIRDGGFGIIEVCSFPAHLDYHDRDAVTAAARSIHELHLEPYSFHAPFADSIDITSPDREVRDRSLHEIGAAAAAAGTIGVRYFVLHPGPERSDVPRAERLDRMENAARSLDEIAAVCHRMGIELVLENMLPHLFSGHVRELLWLMGALESAHVGICLDTGHAFLSGDLARVAHRLSGHLWMLHASDTQGTYDDHLPPGDGRVPWHDLMLQLARSGFHGGIILEIAGDDDLEAILDGAQRARLFLRDLTARVAGVVRRP